MDDQWRATYGDDGVEYIGHGPTPRDAAMDVVMWVLPATPCTVTATGPGGEAVAFDVGRDGAVYVLVRAG